MPELGKTAFSRESIGNVLGVAIGVSLVCSILVASTAVLLKPRQQRNAEEFRQRIILDLAGRDEPGKDLAVMFAAIEEQRVEIASGESLPVYLVHDGDRLEQVILPVSGPGLWSTMYGYLAVDDDGNTVRGLRFYDHAETPGLGDGVDRPAWRDQWLGKRLYGLDGEPRIEVVKGLAPPASEHEIDGLSGATLTGRGVTLFIRHWIGDAGFGPFLARIRAREDRS